MGEIIPPIEEIATESLGYHLSRFILEVRKKDGTEFPQRVCTILFVESSITLDSMESQRLTFQRCPICRI